MNGERDERGAVPDRDEGGAFDGDLGPRLRAAAGGPVGGTPSWSTIENRGRRRIARRRVVVAGAATAVVLMGSALAVAASNGRTTTQVAVGSAGSVPGSAPETSPLSASGFGTYYPGPNGCDTGQLSTIEPQHGPTGSVVLADPYDDPGPHADVEVEQRPHVSLVYIPTELNPGITLARAIVETTDTGSRTLYALPDDQAGSVGAPIVAGDWLYYLANDSVIGPATIRRVPLSGGTPEDVVRDPQSLRYSVSADGSKVVRLVQSTTPPFAGELAVTDVATGTERRIPATRSDGASVQDIVVDDDGTHAFVTVQTSSLYNCDTGETVPYMPGPGEPGAGARYGQKVTDISVVRVDLTGAATLDDAPTVIDGVGAATVLTVGGHHALALRLDPTTMRPLPMLDLGTGAKLPYVAAPTMSSPADFWLGDLGFRIIDAP